jgi:hypothetical protein
MKNPDHARFAEWDAAYVLGGLSPADRREFEDHLEDCERCLTAVQELSGLPGLLGRIDDARAFALLEEDGEGDAADRTPDTRADTLATVDAIRSHERRRRRRRIALNIGALAAAAVLASVLTLVLPPLLSPAPLPDAQVPLNAIDGEVTSVSMLVSAHRVAWGTELDVDCYYSLDPSAIGGSYGPVPYSLWVVGNDGSETSVSTWSAPPNTPIEFAAATATELDDIAEFQLRTVDGGQTLLSGDVSE